MTSSAKSPASAPALSNPSRRTQTQRPCTSRATAMSVAGYHASTSPARAAIGCRIGAFTSMRAAGMPRRFTEGLTGSNPDSAGVILLHGFQQWHQLSLLQGSMTRSRS